MFTTKAQRIAAIRAAYSAAGTFVLTLIGAWAIQDYGILDKPVLAPAIIAALAILGFRGGVEGAIDKGTTTIKPKP